MEGLSPRVVVVMGVSGSGKSTLGAALADRLGCAFIEGDAFHAPASIGKMRAGRPLDDADRWPWLDRLGATARAAVARQDIAVLACSALKRSYRDRLALAAGMPLLFVLLDTDEAELARRLAERADHYMPPCLLASQLATLERPAVEECAVTLDATQPLQVLAAEAFAWLARVGWENAPRR